MIEKRIPEINIANMKAERLDYIIILIAVLFIITSIITVYYNRKKTSKILDQLWNMIDKAMSGSFNENDFNETKVSALEVKMKQYLLESKTMSDNISEEKNSINALISDISHQTKTPISNVLLYTQLLLEQELPKDTRKYANQISFQAEKLSFLISALIKTSRLENGIISVEPIENRVNDLLAAVIRQIEPKTENKQITLIYEENKDTAYFDMKWTIEAVYNIVDNAVKYTPSGGMVKVTSSTYEFFSRIDIADIGIGISEDEVTKIYARFYRGALVGQQEGVGIGLYLAREIITMQGGYIKVQSSLGRGSTFSIFLPKEKHG